MDWSSVDWSALERLRAVFLDRDANAADGGPYWQSHADLASYDFTFGRRIAWKWAAVLEPLLSGGWEPPARQLVDWGCGGGIAARSLLAHAAPGAFDEVVLWDHSPLATTFAHEMIRARFPTLPIRVGDPAELAIEGAFVLVLSHVINELDASGRAAALALARRAAAVLWVEPGAAEDSRALIGAREELRADFHCVAPCPHRGPCGLLAPENERHWCHFFARAPTECFTTAGWATFAQRLGIDLRRLPYSYLVLDRRTPSPARPETLVRVVGEPRLNSSGAVMKILRSRADGVREIELQKRDAPALWRTLEKGRHAGFYDWNEQDGRIVSGEPRP